MDKRTNNENLERDATMKDLDDYLEMLYEISGKNKDNSQSQTLGTFKILQLCRNVINLEQLIQNSTVMGALTRVLQEEYKKSVEVTFNILR
jgi:excinuclease UvrABC ATPase subunit